MAILFILATFVSTIVGGLIGLKYRDKLHLILGFTAGILLAVVAFDIFPEIIELVNKLNISSYGPMLALVAGFLLFHVVEKLVLIHHNHEQSYGPHHHPAVGVLSAVAISAHSFLDGVGIGLGFQISTTTGIAVAIAVLAHNFSDGLNTVSLMLRHQNTNRRAVWFLLLNAMAPVVGGLSTMWFTVSATALVTYLGFFAGFLLYIGASDILPEAHSQNSSYKTILATVAGVVFIILITKLQGG